MKNSVKSKLFRRLFALSSALVVMLFAGGAFAAGSVKWTQSNIKEDADGAWSLQLVITLARNPDLPTVPMRFSFEQIAYYERSKVDGDRIVERTVPMRFQTPHNESMDVGFRDTRGNTVRRTRFGFSLSRDSGFEAGEYKVRITNSVTGQKIGGVSVIKLQGDNDVIDRRTISFEAEKPKTKKKPPPELTDVQEGTFRTTSGEMVVEEEETAEAVEIPAATSARSPAGTGPQPIKENPGACGCRAAGASPTSGGFAALAAAALAIAMTRRRRS